MSETVAARDAWVLAVLGLDVRSAAPAANEAAHGMQGWQTARRAAVDTLRDLAAEVGNMEDYAQAPEAVILLRAIAANLTVEPSTPEQRAELRRYLETDPIIVEAEEPNGFGVTVALREPLLAALAGLESGSK